MKLRQRYKRLNFWNKLAVWGSASSIVAFFLFLIIWVSPIVWKWINPPNIFEANVSVTMRLKWPGPLLYVYPSAFGETISPVSIAMFVEVTNLKPIISKVRSYKFRAFMEYDEGGTLKIGVTPNNKYKITYIPGGKLVRKWRDLYSMGFLQNIYYAGDDWSKSKKIDFSKNGFDNLAQNKQLRPGESIIGWIFFEIEQDLRGQLPKIIKIEMTFENSAGEKQKFIEENKGIDKSKIATSYLNGGPLHLQAGYYDLTTKEYSLLGMMDIPKMLKEGSQTVKAKHR